MVLVPLLMAPAVVAYVAAFLAAVPPRPRWRGQDHGPHPSI
jgi:hypothetical protein